jgi:glycosyltransferase involved in cell wall biosynthesis
VLPYAEIRNMHADLLVCFWWKELERLLHENMFRRSIVCLYDHFSWTGGHHDLFNLECATKRADVIAVANTEIAQLMEVRKLTNGKPMFLVEDGVDTEHFSPYAMPPKLTLGWCGNSAAARGIIKGLPLVREAARRTGAELKVLDLSKGETLTHDQMPAWYATLSAYVCASAAEGTPNPVLEAMACGRPVITTKVGLTPRIVQDGVSGFFTERSVEGIEAAIEKLKRTDMEMMSRAARRAAMSYDWFHKMPAWDACLAAAMEYAL